jgi:hypothetical protein
MDNSELVTKKDLAEFETKIEAKIDTKFEGMEDRLTELIRDVETKLLTAFHGYGKGQAARMHVLEVSDSATAQRLAALEERVLNLETHRGPGSR